jgi:hypothetical protein
MLGTGRTWQNGVMNLKREEVLNEIRSSVITDKIIQKN